MFQPRTAPAIALLSARNYRRPLLVAGLQIESDAVKRVKVAFSFLRPESLDHEVDQKKGTSNPE